MNITKSASYQWTVKVEQSRISPAVLVNDTRHHRVAVSPLTHKHSCPTPMLPVWLLWPWWAPVAGEAGGRAGSRIVQGPWSSAPHLTVPAADPAPVVYLRAAQADATINLNGTGGLRWRLSADTRWLFCAQRQCWCGLLFLPPSLYVCDYDAELCRAGADRSPTGRHKDKTRRGRPTTFPGVQIRCHQRLCKKLPICIVVEETRDGNNIICSTISIISF